jgi:hypothetical protein
VIVVLIGVAFLLLFVVLPIVLLSRYLREDEVESGGSWGRQLLRRRTSSDDPS